MSTGSDRESQPKCPPPGFQREWAWEGHIHIDEALATVSLELESRPECITLVRSTLAGVGDFLQLDPELLDDLKTAISEACNNVVLHAYGGETGPLRMSLAITPEDFSVSVRDQGVGIQRVSPAADRMGVGLAVISALARRAEFLSEPGKGTEVRMSFGTDGLGEDGELFAWSRGDAEWTPVAVSGDIVVRLAPVELLGELMGRLVRAVAAGAHFSVDRFYGLHTLTGALGARAAELDGDRRVAFAITGRPKRLELEVGPLPAGSSGALFGGELPVELLELIERIDATRLNDAELVRVQVVEPRR